MASRGGKESRGSEGALIRGEQTAVTAIVNANTGKWIVCKIVWAEGCEALQWYAGVREKGPDKYKGPETT